MQPILMAKEKCTYISIFHWPVIQLEKICPLSYFLFFSMSLIIVSPLGTRLCETVIVTIPAVIPEGQLQWAEGKRETGHLKHASVPHCLVAVLQAIDKILANEDTYFF